MTRTEDAILAVPMGNAGIRIKDIHRQKGLRSQRPPACQGPGAAICRVSRHLGTDSSTSDQTGGWDGQDQHRGCAGLSSNL